MIADETLALLRDVARDGDVAALLQALAENGDPYDVKGQINDFEDLANELDELRDEVKANELAVTEAEEKLEAEEDAHAETKSDLADAQGEIASLEEEIADLRAAEKNGEPLPPPRPPPSPVDVKIVVAQKMADLLSDLGKRYQQAAHKAGGRTAAGKAANALAFELLSAAETERAKIPR